VCVRLIKDVEVSHDCNRHFAPACSFSARQADDGGTDPACPSAQGSCELAGLAARANAKEN
jgi:hypothetical protein